MKHNRKQLYFKRLVQLEIVEEVLDLLRKYDRDRVVEKLEHLYFEIQEELRALRRELDPVIADLTT